VTIRLPLLTRLFPLVFSGLIGAFALLVGSTTVAAIMAGLIVVGAPLTFRARLSADAGGITIVNLRTCRIPWSDVAGFSTGSPRFPGGAGNYLFVRRLSGPPVCAYALTTGGVRMVGAYSYRQLDEFAEELERRRSFAAA
jgi:Bacterial PH domain